MRTQTKSRMLCFTFWTGLTIEIALLIGFLCGLLPCLNMGAKGIAFNIIGVLITFLFAFPQESYSEGVGIGLGEMTIIEFEGKRMTVKEHDDLLRKAAEVHRRMAYLGLSYLVIGLGFQLFHEIAG